MRPVRRLSLSLRHFLLALAATGLIPLAVLGVWRIHAAGEHRQAETERALLDVARALASAVESELDGSLATLGTMGHTPALEAGDLRGFYETAREQASGQPDWLGVVLADAAGRPLFRTMAPFDAPSSPIVDPDSMRTALSLRRPVVGQIARGPKGQPAFPVRVPVTDRAGGLYVLSAVIRPDRIVRVIARQNTPPDSMITVLDARGNVVARSRDQDTAAGRPPHPTLLQLVRTGPEAIGNTTTMEGRPILTAATALPRYGWTVAVGTPRRSTFVQGFTAYGAGVAASLALCVALASLLSARMLRTLAGLQRAAAALGAGEPVEVPPSRLREVQLLGHSLQQAAARRDAHERERAMLLASLEGALAQARGADRAKDDFLAVLGHELRNPLAPIAASLDLLDLRDEPGGRRERGIMRRQVNHLRRLVDDLLDISRIVSGKLRIELAAVDLAEVARQTVGALPAQAGHAVALEAPPHAWVRGDESRLAQVLNNLLSNAARFGSTASRVTLDTADGGIRLCVTDNGAGMDAETLRHLFEPFYQAPQPLARHTGGLGLGLAIVRKIVELHGGRVAAASDGPGLGSRFEIVLPAGAPAQDEGERAAAQRQARRRVLLVDDNVDAAATGAALLAWLGHDTRVAHTGTQALALLEGLDAGPGAAQGAPDVAILDIGLPDMDGYALAAALRARLPGLRLVALTGYGQKSDVEQAARAGFDLHLTKPATVDELRAALAG